MKFFQATGICRFVGEKKKKIRYINQWHLSSNFCALSSSFPKLVELLNIRSKIWWRSLNAIKTQKFSYWKNHIFHMLLWSLGMWGRFHTFISLVISVCKHLFKVNNNSSRTASTDDVLVSLLLGLNRRDFTTGKFFHHHFFKRICNNTKTCLERC